MSSRHLRRVLASREMSLEDLSPSEEDDEISTPAAKKPSAFDLLMDDEDESGNDSDEADVEEAESSTKSPSPVATSATKMQNGKQMKTKALDDSDEEFEEALKSLKPVISKAAADKEGTGEEEEWPLFALLEPNSELLDPLLELKSKIGNFNAAAAGPADQRFANLIERVKEKKRIGGSGRTRKARSQIILPQSSWPSVPMAAIGLELKRDSDDSFILEHSQQYVAALRTAVYLMRIGDIDGLVDMIHSSHPYQVDALLVISDYVRMSSSNEACELVEWAIHLMERCFSGSGFNPFAGKGRGSLLPYEIAENRKMHLALFRHAQYLLKRGCYRTALEIGKLMLCFDVEDPLLISPVMAYAALQSKQYDWILEFNEEFKLWKPHHFEWTLSAALVLFYKGEVDKARSLLAETLASYPEAAHFLAKELSLELALLGEHPHVQALAKIYVMKISPLLKDAKLSAWLRSILASTELHPSDNSDEVAFWADPQEHAKLYRHALLSDTQNLNIPFPKSVASSELNLYDPIPPERLGSKPSIVASLADALSSIFGRIF